MRILVTNDDGIDAKGIEILAGAAKHFGDVWVVAPDHQCSAMSQRITLKEKLLVTEYGFSVDVEKAYSISGTPADCVSVAVTYLMPEKPDIIFSGINFGLNTGFDIAYSGTVGAAMEGIMNGIPSIAFSNEATHIYDTVNEYITGITEEIIKRGFRDDSIWNVNFPACSVSECKGVLWDRKIARSPLFQGSFAEEESDGNGRKIAAVGTKKDLSYLSDETDLGAVTRKYISVGYVKSMVLMKDSTINIEGETDGIQ